MAKPRNRVSDYAVYLAVRLVVCVLQALPLTSALALARYFAAVVHRIDRRHREVARDNMRHAYPAASEAAIDRHVRGVYRHFCTVLVEMVQLPRRLHQHNWQRYVELDRSDPVIGALTAGRPLLLVS